MLVESLRRLRGHHALRQPRPHLPARPQQPRPRAAPRRAAAWSTTAPTASSSPAPAARRRACTADLGTTRIDDRVRLCSHAERIARYFPPPKEPLMSAPRKTRTLAVVEHPGTRHLERPRNDGRPRAGRAREGQVPARRAAGHGRLPRPDVRDLAGRGAARTPAGRLPPGRHSRSSTRDRKAPARASGSPRWCTTCCARARCAGRPPSAGRRAEVRPPAREPAHALPHGPSLRRVGRRGRRGLERARRDEGLAQARRLLAGDLAGRRQGQLGHALQRRARDGRAGAAARRLLPREPPRHRRHARGARRGRHPLRDVVGPRRLGRRRPRRSHRLPEGQRSAATPSPSSPTTATASGSRTRGAPKWGYHGFCHVTYDDWLRNGTDVWVGRLGAPVGLASRTTAAAAAVGPGDRRAPRRPWPSPSCGRTW